jgi:hypothetical protein
MVRDVDIERCAPVNRDLLGAAQELKTIVDELVDGIEAFASAGAPTSQMTVERYQELGKLVRLIIFARMYACEFSSNLLKIAGLVPRDDSAESQEFHWGFNGLSSLDGLWDYANEVVVNIVIQRFGCGKRDIPGLLDFAQRYKQGLDLFVKRLEALALAAVLPRALAYA